MPACVGRCAAVPACAVPLCQPICFAVPLCQPICFAGPLGQPVPCRRTAACDADDPFSLAFVCSAAVPAWLCYVLAFSRPGICMPLLLCRTASLLTCCAFMPARDAMALSAWHCGPSRGASLLHVRQPFLGLAFECLCCCAARPVCCFTLHAVTLLVCLFGVSAC